MTPISIYELTMDDRGATLTVQNLAGIFCPLCNASVENDTHRCGEHATPAQPAVPVLREHPVRRRNKRVGR